MAISLRLHKWSHRPLKYIKASVSACLTNAYGGTTRKAPARAQDLIPKAAERSNEEAKEEGTSMIRQASTEHEASTRMMVTLAKKKKEQGCSRHLCTSHTQGDRDRGNLLAYLGPHVVTMGSDTTKNTASSRVSKNLQSLRNKTARTNDTKRLHPHVKLSTAGDDVFSLFSVVHTASRFNARSKDIVAKHADCQRVGNAATGDTAQ